MKPLVKLIIAVHSDEEGQIRLVEERMASEYGSADHRSSVIALSGASHLMLMSFERLVDVEQVAEIRAKHFSTFVNAGHLENSKVVFQQDVLHFRNGGVHFLPETPPHYQSNDGRDFFLTVRHIYRDQLRTMCLLRE